MGVAVLTLSTVRKDLAEVLTAAGIKTHARTPEVFNPPAAVIENVEDYMDYGTINNHMTVRYDVIYMVNSSPKWVEEVEAMIPKALMALMNAGWQIDRVTLEQFVVTATSHVYEGVRLRVSGEIPIGDIT